jgi:N-acetylneuraminate lyase
MVCENIGVNDLGHLTFAQQDTVELAKHARAVGADAVSSVTPLYYRYTFREVKYYYERIAEAAELPVIIYNIPALTGMVLSAAQLNELLSIPGVSGMKFTSSDFFQLERLRTAFPDHIFYNGSDEMLLSGLVAGADGGIGTTYNYQMETVRKVYDCFRAGDMAGALEAQTQVARVVSMLFKYITLPVSKVILEGQGYSVGSCVRPMKQYTPEEKKAILADFRSAGLKI